MFTGMCLHLEMQLCSDCRHMAIGGGVMSNARERDEDTIISRPGCHLSILVREMMRQTDHRLDRETRTR